jgi:hypothetical protein
MVFSLAVMMIVASVGHHPGTENEYLPAPYDFGSRPFRASGMSAASKKYILLKSTCYSQR